MTKKTGEACARLASRLSAASLGGRVTIIVSPIALLKAQTCAAWTASVVVDPGAAGCLACTLGCGARTSVDESTAVLADTGGTSPAPSGTTSMSESTNTSGRASAHTGNGGPDITPLAGLTKLRALTLRDNLVSNLGPIAGLIDLKSLELSGRSIAKLEPLANLVNLTQLHIFDGQVTDLAPLAGLINLAHERGLSGYWGDCD